MYPNNKLAAALLRRLRRSTQQHPHHHKSQQPRSGSSHLIRQLTASSKIEPHPYSTNSGGMGMVHEGKKLYKHAQTNPVTSPEELPVGSSRIRLRDGRYLAYTEKGVPKNKANYRIILVHGFASSKEMNFLAPQGLIEELGIYFLLFDRAGYGGSDPNPKRSVESEALDIQELADQLEIGSKFYVIGVSMGSYPCWGCLKHIPERLAGLALVAPVINYCWPSLPKSLLQKDPHRKTVQLYYWIAKYASRLVYWWVNNKFSPATAVMQQRSVFFSQRDLEALEKTTGFPMLTKEKLRQRSIFNTLRGDFMACFGDWGFDPLNLSNPFPKDPSPVHIWQGHEDKVVPCKLQRFVSTKLPWIQYHEVPDGGHLLIHYDGIGEAVLRALLLGEENSLYKPAARPQIVV